MSEARKIAEALGLATAADVKARELPSEPVRGRQPIRWTLRRRDIFNFIGPVSISLVATDGPYTYTEFDPRGGSVRRRIGHNRAVWPMRLVKGAVARDAATTTWNRHPSSRVATQVRMWCLREADRDRLMARHVDLLDVLAERDGGLEQFDHDFVDVGPEADLAFLEMEMHGAARDLGIAAWDDAGLLAWFDSISRRFDRLKSERPELQWSERLVARIAEKDLEAVEKERGAR